MTNREKINAMSNEELAEFLYTNFYSNIFLKICDDNEYSEYKGYCGECKMLFLAKWLSEDSYEK